MSVLMKAKKEETVQAHKTDDYLPIYSGIITHLSPVSSGVSKNVKWICTHLGHLKILVF